MRGWATPARAADNGLHEADRRSAWRAGPTTVATAGQVTGRERPANPPAAPRRQRGT